MNKTVIAIIGAALLIGGAVLLSGSKSPVGASTTEQANNVSVVDGKQIVEIGVKGGYSPQQSFAKAGMPTILRMKTNGTFDCSSGVRIPSIGYSQNLPASGATDIEIPMQKAGTALDGVCVMGMYHFQVAFK